MCYTGICIMYNAWIIDSYMVVFTREEFVIRIGNVLFILALVLLVVFCPKIVLN